MGYVVLTNRTHALCWKTNAREKCPTLSLAPAPVSGRISVHLCHFVHPNKEASVICTIIESDRQRQFLHSILCFTLHVSVSSLKMLRIRALPHKYIKTYPAVKGRVELGATADGTPDVLVLLRDALQNEEPTEEKPKNR